MNFVAMIYAARNEAAGIRAGRRGGLAESAVRTAQMIAPGPPTRESVARACVRRPRHSLPGEAASGGPGGFSELPFEAAPPSEETGLNHRQQWILAEVRKGTKLRRPDVIRKFNVSVPTAKRDLAALGAMIEFIGPARGGFYK